MKTPIVVICDDDRPLQKILRRDIEKQCEDCGISCRIFCCDSGEEVLLLDKDQTPDILFLDIQMSGKNGMEIAKDLRRRKRDMILIFVTAMSEYVYEAFDVNAFHYLVKPFTVEKLREVFGKALCLYEKQQEIEKIRQAGQEDGATDALCENEGQKADRQARFPKNQPAILVKRGGLSTKVFLEDIIYAEVYNRKVMLHTTNGDIEYYGKLTDLSEQAGLDFYRTHRAYLVNFKYVEKYNASTVWLEQGTALISKKQFAGFVKQYMQYINRKKEK